MNKSLLQSGLCVLLFFTASLQLAAQQNHFIYLQTENKQPFYVKMDKKVMSSSASGYLIIPKLIDGEYPIVIGFPKNEWPEQNITCNVNNKDAGYVLKNFGDKGWGLFNLQTLQIVMAGTKNKDVAAAAAVSNKNDDFASTLSNVVKDPSIAKKEEEIKDTVAVVAAREVKLPEIKEPEVKSTEVKPADVKTPETKKTETEVKQLDVKQAEITPEKGTSETSATKPAGTITKLLASNGADGTDIIYVDVVNGLADTIRVFIPAEIKSTDTKNEKIEKPVDVKPVTKTEEINTGIKNEIKPDTIAPDKKVEVKPEIKSETKPDELKPDNKTVTDTELKKETVDKTPKFIDITLPNPNAKADTVVKLAAPVITEKKTDISMQVTEKPKENNTKPVMINSDCKAAATEDDFLKLRKKMAAENNDDDMVTVAKKVFKSKCFTTDQIKNLSVLFLKDEGKYKFFDAAYPFTSDSYNFSSLETQLTDSYFINRFKVMIRH